MSEDPRERREESQAEAERRRSTEELERRVDERTAELAEANAALARREEEIRRAHAFLDSIVENLPDMVFVKDARDLSLVRLNLAAEEMLGVRRDDVIGRTFHDILPAVMADEFTEQDREVIRTGCPVDLGEEVVATRARGPRILHTKKIPIFDSHGNAQYLLGISQDITERRTAEESARLSKLEAERANRAKNDFLSRMSHDLRTPLNAVLGFAQILELDARSPEEIDSVRQILNGGRHLVDLINEVLDIASIEAGRLALSPEPVDVNEIVQQVLDLLRPLADARRIALLGVARSESPVHVRADRQRLTQILVNLVGNAVKYSRDPGTVTVFWEELPGGVVRTNVADSGPGIAAEKMPLLFQPFERLGEEGGAIEGTGLGLALSKNLAVAMRGSLRATSTPGVGTTFSIELPRADAPASQPAAATADYGSTATVASAGTVLYIEDNRANIRLLERVLARRPGVRLISATTGVEGIAAAERQSPDLILLDLHLPDGPGDQVLQRLRAEPATRGIPVAVVSADATQDRRESVLGSGAVAYLTKPLDISRLLRLIDGWLTGPATDGKRDG